MGKNKSKYNPNRYGTPKPVSRGFGAKMHSEYKASLVRLDRMKHEVEQYKTSRPELYRFLTRELNRAIAKQGHYQEDRMIGVTR